MLDSTVSWKRVTDVVKPFVDSICVAATDEESINNRMFVEHAPDTKPAEPIVAIG